MSGDRPQLVPPQKLFMGSGCWMQTIIVCRGGSSHGSARAIVFSGSDLAQLVIGSAKSSSAWLEPADLGSVLARFLKNLFDSTRAEIFVARLGSS